MITKQDQWLSPPSDLHLLEHDIHIFRLSLDQPPSFVQSLKSYLNKDELTRAQRFHFEKDQLHFITARGVLKFLLAHYLQLEDVQQVLFQYNSYGKPALKNDKYQWLSFNISHSHNMALLAFARGREIGVDIEFMRSGIEYEDLAQRFFSPLEATTLLSLPSHMRQAAFFAGWTRKEAYIKARGMGLSLPLDSFDVTLREDQPVALLASRENPLEVERWAFEALYPDPDYAATLVVEGKAVSIHLWDWNNNLIGD